MKLSVLYGKMSKSGIGDFNINLGTFELENEAQFLELIEDKKEEILSGYSFKRGEYVEVVAINIIGEFEEEIIYIEEIRG